MFRKKPFFASRIAPMPLHRLPAGAAICNYFSSICRLEARANRMHRMHSPCRMRSQRDSVRPFTSHIRQNKTLATHRGLPPARLALCLV
jgi:hypothetical protein